MASALIHIAVAKELENSLKIKRKKDYYLGSIAPDISKQIGKTKFESHFLKNSYKNNVPNIDLFIKKYHDFINNSFDLGYFIHLYTDKLWFDGFIDKLKSDGSIKLLDGTILTTNPEEINAIIYSDYTNMNTQLLDDYNLDLSLFYEELPKPKTNIHEIPIDKLDILVNKMGLIIENSKEKKGYSIDITLVENFIDNAVKEIKKYLENYK